MKYKSIISALALAAGLTVSADPMDSQSTVEVGKWCNNFPAAYEYAEANNIPLLVFWANPGCSQCSLLETACKESDFVAWQNERKIVMVFAYGRSTAEQKAAYTWIRQVKGLKDFPFIGVYWKANAAGATVSAAFTGRRGRMPVTKGSLQEQLMGSVDNLIAGWSPSGVTPAPTPTPSEPVVDVRSDAYGKARTITGLIQDNDSGAYAGSVSMSIGKIKNNQVKITAKAMLFTGKSYSAKWTADVAEDGSATGELAFKTPVGTMLSLLAYDATSGVVTVKGIGTSYTMEAGLVTVGGAIAKTTLLFGAEVGGLTAPEGLKMVTTLPTNELITVRNGTKWSCRKAASVKYAKDAYGNWALTGLDDAAKPNVSGLKLSYQQKTGVFSGSFKVYASNADSVGENKKPKLTKYTATVRGVMVNGLGYGMVVVKVGKTSYTGSCFVE